MSNRTFFWSRCLVLVLAGALVTAPGYAKSPLQWKSPKTDNTAAKTNANSIQLVRFDRQQVSPEAQIDTDYPESRPSSGYSPGVTIPQPGGTNSLRGSELDNLYGSGSEGGLRGIVKGSKVEIRCPEDNILKPITGISFDIRLDPGSAVPKECGLGGDDYFPARDFEQICFMWKASALCHKPLYFEEVALERYGHTLVREEFQPIISGAKFFLTVPILPYKMGINPPCECIYTLGHYRPGSCAPYMVDPLPLSVRAGLVQAGVVVGGVAIFP
ncbi:MAG: hypothetical protein FWC43_03455 [Planctomycetaceae bacterium]|nr:hypothetical protein [Planctomycetaceae bacterium]